MIQHMYSFNQSMSQNQPNSHDNQLDQQMGGHIQNQNPFSFDPMFDSSMNPMQVPNFSATYLTRSANSAPGPGPNSRGNSIDTSPLSTINIQSAPSPTTQVPVCKGTSKHFFKLENKIALLKEVIAQNPFEDSSRWKIVSDNYNIWTSQHQPDRFYAAVDYLPRKVREMLANFKLTLDENSPLKSSIKEGSTCNDNDANDNSNIKGENSSNNNNNSSGITDSTGNTPNNSGSNTPNNLQSSDMNDETEESQELRALLYEVYNLMTSVVKNEKPKRNSSKRIKLETPRLLSGTSVFRSPDKMDVDYRKATSPNITNTSTNTNPVSAVASHRNSMTQFTSPVQQFPQNYSFMEDSFNFTFNSQSFASGNTHANAAAAAVAAVSGPGSAGNPGSQQADNSIINTVNKMLQPVVSRLTYLETKLLVMENINRNNGGLPANVVPFPNSLKPGNVPFQNLPLLRTALDIENLGRDQLNVYLKYYEITYSDQEAKSVALLKKKLAAHVGILNPNNYSDK